MPDFGRFFNAAGDPSDLEKRLPALLGGFYGPMNDGNRDAPRYNPSIPAGFSAFGQFVTHDLVKTTPSTLADGSVDVDTLENHATPFFDLDSVYGRAGGKAALPHPKNSQMLAVRIENNTEFDDLPRDMSEEAHIPDPRNDSNLIVSQLHLAFLKAHNRIVDSGHDFETARSTLRLHYQWLVRHEYLPGICGEAIDLRDVEEELKLYRWEEEDDPFKDSFLPVEFTGAAFCFGHSDVRSGYRINDDYWLYIATDDPAEDDLSGGRKVPPARRASWSHFFDFPERSRKPQQAHRIDTWISAPLLQLPVKALRLSARKELRSLATRDLQRGLNLRLPSGSEVAAELKKRKIIEKKDVLTPEEIWKYAPLFGEMSVADPLWYYILREADEQNDGKHLGKVGARLVAETIIGLLKRDPESILNREDWHPWLGDGSTGDFKIRDLLRFARLPV